MDEGRTEEAPRGEAVHAMAVVAMAAKVASAARAIADQKMVVAPMDPVAQMARIDEAVGAMMVTRVPQTDRRRADPGQTAKLATAAAQMVALVPKDARRAPASRPKGSSKDSTRTTMASSAC
jgi:hypothetical protein